MKTPLLATGLAAVLGTAPAFAAESSVYTAPTQAYLGALLDYVDADSARGFGINRGSGLGLLYGRNLGQHWGWEARISSQRYITSSTLKDFYRPGLGLDAVYALYDRDAWTPYLLGGGGMAYNEAPPGSKQAYEFFLDAGAGMVSGLLYETARARGEVRYVYDNYGDGLKDLHFTLGVEIPMFRLATVGSAEEGMRVVPVAAGLGDSDGDGVVDEQDACPDTGKGSPVGGNGCALPPVLPLRGVNFELNSLELTPSSQGVLDDVATILLRYSDMQVEVAGHTDETGTEEHNQRLSQQRADAVRQYLVNKSVEGGRLTAAGYGGTQPAASNDTEQGRLANRRVELRIKL